MQHSFTDNQGRAWPLRINRDTERRVKAMTGYDLSRLAKSRAAFLRIASDPVTFCEFLWALVVPDAGQRQISTADFAGAFVGVTQDAMQALASALNKAYPRERLTAVNRAIRDLEAAARRGSK